MISFVTLLARDIERTADVYRLIIVVDPERRQIFIRERARS